MDAVNTASSHVGRDVAAWPADRLLALLAQLEAERRQQGQGPPQQ